VLEAGNAKKMRAIEDNGTWCLEDLSARHRDEYDNIVKHKARLVVKGYAQRRVIDYDDVFAPVARLDSVRLLIALAAQEGWEVHHLDVKSAFLNGELKDEVFVQQPAGFVETREEHKVFRLRKALYGLHQAPRAWNAKLDETLIAFGFSKCSSEPAIYDRRVDGKHVVIGVYVDDLMVTGNNREDIKQFKSEMAKVFHMSDLLS
jgi:hypothetical protein